MTEKEIAVRAVGLRRVFDGQPVLQNVDLDLAEGEIVALEGANGAGKTTLLRCLAAAVRPDGGEVRWYGHLPRERQTPGSLVGMVAHESRLYPHMTLRENLIFAARMCDVRRPSKRADHLLQNIDLERYAGHLPMQVSKGMRQRVSTVRALVHDPRIVLLDEPFSGLDTEGAEWLSDLLRNLRDWGRAVCFATHDPRMSRSMADRVLVLRSGRLTEFVSDENRTSQASRATVHAA